MLVKQKITGVFWKIKEHVYKTRKFIWFHLQAWLFSSDLILPVKMVELTAATCKYCCPLIVSPTITNCCKGLHLKCGRVPRSVLKTSPYTKTSPVSYENQYFFLTITKCCHLYRKSLCFSVTFYSMMKYFWSAF